MTKIDNTLPYSVYRSRHEKRTRVSYRLGCVSFIVGALDAISVIICSVGFLMLDIWKTRMIALIVAGTLIAVFGIACMLRSKCESGRMMIRIFAGFLAFIFCIASLFLMFTTLICGARSIAVFVYFAVALICCGLCKGVAIHG